MSCEHVEQHLGRRQDTPASSRFRSPEYGAAVLATCGLLGNLDCAGEEIHSTDTQPGNLAPAEAKQRSEVRHRRVIGSECLGEPCEFVACYYVAVIRLDG
jgi:hypothetical protein